jgi:CRP/FNR family transcriptional regulator
MDSSIKTTAKAQTNPKIVCATCPTRSKCLNSTLSINEVDSLPSQYIHCATFHEGDYLYRKGDPLTHIYNLRFGSIKSEIILQDGLRQVTHFSLPGELLGLDGISNGKHQVDTICLSTTEVCLITIGNLKKLTREFPSLMNGIENSLGALLNTTNIHMFDLVNLNATEKLADFLITYSNQLSVAGYDRDNFTLTMNRADLASYLGVKIETLSRSFGQLEKMGAIKITNRQVQFISREPIFDLINPQSLREKHNPLQDKDKFFPTSLNKRKT